MIIISFFEFRIELMEHADLLFKTTEFEFFTDVSIYQNINEHFKQTTK